MAITFNQTLDPDTLGLSNGDHATSVVLGSETFAPGDTLTDSPTYHASATNGKGTLKYVGGAQNLVSGGGLINTAFGGTNTFYVQAYIKNWGNGVVFGRGRNNAAGAVIHAVSAGIPAVYNRIGPMDHLAASQNSAVIGYYRQNIGGSVVEEWYVNGDLTGSHSTPAASYPDVSGNVFSFGSWGNHGFDADGLEIGKFQFASSPGTRAERVAANVSLTSYYGIDLSSFDPIDRTYMADPTKVFVIDGNSTDEGTNSTGGRTSGPVLAALKYISEHPSERVKVYNMAIAGRSLIDQTAMVGFYLSPIMDLYPSATYYLWSGEGHNLRSQDNTSVSAYTDYFATYVAALKAGSARQADYFYQRQVALPPSDMDDTDTGQVTGLRNGINDYYRDDFDGSTLLPMKWRRVDIDKGDIEIFATGASGVHPGDTGYALERDGGTGTRTQFAGNQDWVGFYPMLIADTDIAPPSPSDDLQRPWFGERGKKKSRSALARPMASEYAHLPRNDPPPVPPANRTAESAGPKGWEGVRRS